MMNLVSGDLAAVVVVRETQVGGNWFGHPMMKEDSKIKAFCISMSTFNLILKNIRTDIERDFITEEPVSADCRLAICLYRLDRGDYLYTIAELFRLGVMILHKINEEVCETIVSNLWKLSVQAHFPTTRENFMEKMVDIMAALC